MNLKNRSIISFFGVTLFVVIVMGTNVGFTKHHLDFPYSHIFGYLPIPILAAFIIYAGGFFDTTGYLYKEEQLFKPYFLLPVQDKLRVITSIALLGAIPLIAALFLQPPGDNLLFTSWDHLYLIGCYLFIVSSYSAMLFYKSRQFYNRYSASVSIGLIGPLMLVADMLNLKSNLLSMTDWSIVVGLTVMIYFGTGQLLKASRTISDKRAQSEAELKFAGEVQQKFLQSRSCSAGGIQSYGLSQPAADLGGDFFHLETQSNRLIAAVGDVSGHSYGAGLIMVMLKTAFENHLAYHDDPADVLRILNQKLVHQTDRTTFATLGILTVELETHRATLWSAGHMPLIHYMADDEQIAHRNGKGFALGIRKDIDVVPCHFSLSPGDRLLMYSDGLVETRNDDQTVRGLDDFFELADSLLPALSDPKQIAAELLARIDEQHAYEVRDDDATVIALHRTH